MIGFVEVAFVLPRAFSIEGKVDRSDRRFRFKSFFEDFRISFFQEPSIKEPAFRLLHTSALSLSRATLAKGRETVKISFRFASPFLKISQIFSFRKTCDLKNRFSPPFSIPEPLFFAAPASLGRRNMEFAQPRTSTFAKIRFLHSQLVIMKPFKVLRFLGLFSASPDKRHQIVTFLEPFSEGELPFSRVAFALGCPRDFALIFGPFSLRKSASFSLP